MTYTSSSLASKASFSCWRANRLSASSLVLINHGKRRETTPKETDYAQDVSTLSVVLQNHRMVFPQGRPVRYGQKSNTKFCSMLHHHAFHLRGNEGSSLVKHGILNQQTEDFIRADSFEQLNRTHLWSVVK